jgi:transposase-like protein
MILFCEDCGAKNRVDTSALKNSRAAFICSECRYKNNYFLEESGSSPSPKQRDENLSQTKGAKTVLGYFIMTREHRIVKNRMPSMLKK